MSEHKLPFERLREEFVRVGEDGLVYRSVPFWIWNVKPEPSLEVKDSGGGGRAHILPR